MPSPEELRDLLARVQKVKNDILLEGMDYGTIPGTPKPSLWKPGAEKMCQFFGYRVSAMDLQLNTTDPFGVLYKCTLSDGQGRIVGVCDGWCDDGEKGRRGNPRNTIIKMAQKRAFVGAVLVACNASELFTQDVEDFYDAPKGSYVEVPFDTTTGEVKDATAKVEQQLRKPKVEEFNATESVSTGEYGIHIYNNLVSEEAFWLSERGLDKEAADNQAKVNVAAACKAAGYANTDEVGRANGAKQMIQLQLSKIHQGMEQAAETPKEEVTGALRLQQLVTTYQHLGPELIYTTMAGLGIHDADALLDNGVWATVVSHLDAQAGGGQGA